MKRSNNTKKLIINALLLGIGAILHQITPALGIPMQPDFALAMMLIVIIINNGDYKTSLIAGIITGIFTALTTKFPLGQVPNVIDKLVTVNIMYIIIVCLNKVILNNNYIKKFKFVILGLVFALGTLISGTTFLVSASIIVGLPVSFTVLFVTVVMPTVLINSIAGVILYKVVISSLKKVILL